MPVTKHAIAILTERLYAADGFEEDAQSIAEVLLANQYVSLVDRGGRRRYWRIIKGTGHGLTFSGDVANGAHARSVEAPHMKDKYMVDEFFCIRLRMRVFNDVFVVMRGTETRAYTLLKHIRNLSSIWSYDAITSL